MNSAGQCELVKISVNYCCNLDIQSVLCVGVGDGTECNLFSEKKKEVTGITLNLNKVKTESKVLKMDMHEMTFGDGEFDLVFSKDCFEHAISHVIAFYEIVRVAKKFIYIVMPDFESWKYGKWHYLIPNHEQMVVLGERMGVELQSFEKIKIPGHAEQSCYLFKK